MHYCCFLVTKEFPSDEIIAKKLSPFEWQSNIDAEPQPAFAWDWWQIGGRYSGKLKLSINKNVEVYDWKYYATVPRAGRLFRSKVLEAIRTIMNQHDTHPYIHPYSLYHEEDLYNELGYRDGYIRVDGARIGDLIDFEKCCNDCYCVVDVDDNVYTRSKLFEDDDEFDRTIQNIFMNGNRDDYYVVVVDLHD